MAKTSNYSGTRRGIDKVVAGSNTVDVDFIKAPNPVLLNPADRAARHEPRLGREEQVGRARDIKTKDESHAHRNAMGTGPYMVRVAARPEAGDGGQPQWWGQGQAWQRDRGHLHPIKSEATRGRAAVGRRWISCSTRRRRTWSACSATRRSRWSMGRRTAPFSSAWTSIATSCRAPTSGQEPAEGPAGATGAVSGDRHQRHPQVVMRGLEPEHRHP